MNEPEGLARLRGAGGRSARYRPLDADVANWARALAAAKPGMALLHICESNDEIALWIRAGMDLGSRLVIVMPDKRGTKVLDEVLGSDLRITCHCQDADAFLEDVRSHRFGLIVQDAVPKDSGRIARLWEVLAPGGLLLVCGLDADPAATAMDRTSEVLSARADAAVARHAGAGSTLLATRLIPAPPPIRRGGRRARREPGSVTALRPRT